MIRIGIVDDDPASRELVRSHVSRYGVEHGVAFSVRTWDDGADLAETYVPDYDVLLLDVEMPGMDGFATARHVRGVDRDVLIVFITNMAQHAIQGYEVDALGYLVKPVPYAGLAQELARCVQRVRGARDESILLTTGGTTVRVAVADIEYVESARHRILVRTTSGAHTLTGTLKSFEAELGDKGFYRSNSCYLVNLRHVTTVHPTSCVMRGGDELQVSRSRRRGFLDALTDFVGGRSA